MNSMFAQIILNFTPTTQRDVVVWIHTKAGEHFVGMLSDLLCQEDGHLMVWCSWILRVEPDSKKWRIIKDSKKNQQRSVFQKPFMRSTDGNMLKLLDDNGDMIQLFVSGKRITEARTIINRYEK